MQTKPTNWDNYLAAEHTVDFKIVVDGTTYNRSAIVSLKTSGALYDSFGIGNCCARSMEVEFYPTSAPARQAAVKVYCRLESGGNYTAYIQKGTYFISTRQTDHTKGTLKLTCYDAMLKADRPFTDVFPSDANFPIAPSTAVSSIATALGVTVDARTSLNSSFLVEYPADEDGDMTLREMLGRIAVANAGNWVITDTNKLRLVPLQSSASPILLGAACASLDKGIVSDAIGKVEVLNNSGEVLQEWVFGSYSGKVMSVTYPDAVPNGGVQTQAANPVAYAIYTALNGYVQYGFTANASIIDPCAELGDRLTVGTTGNTLTSTIANEKINFTAEYTANLSAPDADEVDDEYPYQTYQQRVEKKVATTFAQIKKTDNEIKLLVQGLVSAWVSGTSYSVGDMVSKDGKFYRCVTANSDVTFDPDKWEEVSSGIVESCISVAVGKMTLSVAGDGSGSTITLTSGSVRIASAAAYFDTNNAHFSGSLSANKLSAGSIDTTDINLKGAFAVQMYNSSTEQWETVGYVGAATGYDGQTNTKGAVLKSVNGNSYAIVTNAGVRLQRGNTSLWLEDANIRYIINGGDSTPLGYAVFS